MYKSNRDALYLVILLIALLFLTYVVVNYKDYRSRGCGRCHDVYMLNKNTWSVKNAEPIRGNIANRQAQLKGLISAEAKKLLYQIIVTP